MSNTYISRDQVSEYTAHSFSADASELRWAPGFFPESIKTNIGNGMVFIRESFDGFAMKYTQVCGCVTLTVYND